MRVCAGVQPTLRPPIVHHERARRTLQQEEECSGEDEQEDRLPAARNPALAVGVASASATVSAAYRWAWLSPAHHQALGRAFVSQPGEAGHERGGMLRDHAVALPVGVLVVAEDQALPVRGHGFPHVEHRHVEPAAFRELRDGVLPSTTA